MRFRGCVAMGLLVALPVEVSAFQAGNYDDPTLPAMLMVLSAKTGPDRLFENVRVSKPGCLGGWTLVFRYAAPKPDGGTPVDAQSATGSGVIVCAGVATRLVGLGTDRYTASFSSSAPNLIVQDMAAGWGGTFRLRSGALVGIAGRANPFTDAQLRLAVRVTTNRPDETGRVRTMALKDFMTP